MKKTTSAAEAAAPVAPAEPPASAPPAEPTPPAADPRDQEILALKDRLLRLQADFDNFRKRIARDREEQSLRATERILKDILPVADHFAMGVESARKHHVKHSVIEGFGDILKELTQVLEKSGATPIDIAGKPFDPHLHECVAHIPSDEHPDGMIIQETRRGYKLGTYVLRASQVIVSTGPARSVPPPAPESNPPEGCG
jgi:molecular chaperone GrpE